MFKKLDEVETRFEHINQQLQEPGVTSDQNRYRELMKELADLQNVVNSYRDFKKVSAEIKDNKQLLDEESDEELRALAKEDLQQLEIRYKQLQNELRLLLLPKDPNDDKNVILEIRAGAGGDEASLFAEELFRGYSLFAAKMGWKVEPMDSAPGNAGRF